MNTGVKSIFSSVTFWGVMISVVAKLLFAFGVIDLEDGTQKELANMLALYVPLAMGFIGDATALWGRVNSTSVIKPNALTTAKTADHVEAVRDAALSSSS